MDNEPILLPSQEDPPADQPPVKNKDIAWLISLALLLAVSFLVAPSVIAFLDNPFGLAYGVPPTYAPTVFPNLAATQRAWIKPTQSPTLGTGGEAQQADASGNIRTLESRASEKPFIPDINMPGDIYVYELNIGADLSNLWYYSWCAEDRNTLLNNITQMKVEFVLNETAVQDEHIAVQDYERADNEGSCRSFSILVKYWPEGQHQLETHITFIEPTDDGWNLYPAGTHIYKYFAYVDY